MFCHKVKVLGWRHLPFSSTICQSYNHRANYPNVMKIMVSVSLKCWLHLLKCCYPNVSFTCWSLYLIFNQFHLNQSICRTHHDTQTNLKPLVFLAIWLQFMYAPSWWATRILMNKKKIQISMPNSIFHGVKRAQNINENSSQIENSQCKIFTFLASWKCF